MPADTLPPCPAAAAPRRARCPRCDRPLPACLCAWVRPTANRVPVQVLQHPLEAGQAKGSLPLLRLSLQRLECRVGERFEPDALPSAGWRLLYPAAADDPPPGSVTAGLLVLDGTWRKTRRLLHDNPWLAALPRWPLRSPPPSRYAIRKARRPGQLSTLEATCLALGTLEGDAGRYAPLLAAFDGWVADEAARQRRGHQALRR
ncbi:MAG: DTW domain-containing protein [Burkholderiaceae bacterium]|nr:DTW domain-containing protein [Burkholderiaceae bacterium]